MRFGSVCSGIEAASVAWNPLGWEAQFFSEIEPYPCALLKHHYPDVPNFGDMTKFQEWPDVAIDLLCGGTPCQDFSVAGLRAGLAAPRGNLTLTFLGVVAKYQPRIVVWENVPGILSIDGGRAFGAFLGGLAELGYGWAYRVLDAQHTRALGLPYAVPQRRRRVFVVGYFGDWRRAAAVLFDGASLRGDSPPRREAGQGFTHTVAPSLTSSGRGVERGGDTRGQDPVIAVADVSGTLSPGAHPGGFNGQDAHEGKLLAFGGNNTSGPIEVATARNAHAGPHGRLDFESETFVAAAPVVYSIMPQNSGKDYKAREVQVAQPLMAAGPTTGNQGGDDIATPVSFKASHYTRGKDGAPSSVTPPLSADADKGDQDPLVLAPTMTIAFDSKGTQVETREDGVSPTLRSMNNEVGHANGGGQVAVAFDHLAGGNTGFAIGDEVAGALRVSGNATGHQSVQQGWRVRRLTPTECERLMGNDDGYTAIPYRGKIAADGPRYKGLGNSWAVNVPRVIGERIDMVDKL